jgi:importin subunit beta-1
MKSENEAIVLQAIEFWSTVCEEEVDLMFLAADAEEMGEKPEVD